MIGSAVKIVTRVGVVAISTELLADTIIVFVSGVRVDVLAGVNANMVAATATDLGFIAMWGSLEDPLCFCC